MVLLTCKNDEDPIKNEKPRVVTIFHIDFSDAQGQIILYSVVGTCRHSNSFKHLCMSLIPARMKKIQSKRSRYLILSALKPNAAQIMLQMKFGCDRPAGLRDINI